VARRRRRQTRSAENSQLILGAVLIGFVCLALAYGFYFFVGARKSYVELDPQTYCPKNGPASVTALLIDTTDQLNLVQRTDLINEIEKLIQNIPRYGALDIFAVRPTEKQPTEPVFQRCNPGHADEISGWTSNPTMVERDWREGFRKPLDQLFEQMLAPGEANQSPILESIQWLAVNTLGTPTASGLPRSLIVVSDLLQHTSGLSHYRGVASFSAFKKTPYYKQIKAPLEGVTAHLLIVRRNTKKNVQGKALIEFWTAYFDAQGVRKLRLVDLAG